MLHDKFLKGAKMIEEGRRYPDLERKFVLSVCQRAGMFTNGKQAAARKIADHVAERLDKGAGEYGSAQFWHVPIIGDRTEAKTPLFCELQEEAADILGWGALASIRLQQKGWGDLATQLEIAAVGGIHFGDKLKTIEHKVAARLTR